MARTPKSKQPFHHVVSLGSQCQVAFQMNRHGLRTAAYPFDWLITPEGALFDLFKSNFSDFFNKEDLYYRTTIPQVGRFTNVRRGRVYNRRHGIVFDHDFKNKVHWRKEYESNKTKFERRIDRLLRLLQSRSRILFIRKRMSKTNVAMLAALIRTQYPHLDFVLLILDETKEIMVDWEIEGVVNCHMEFPEINEVDTSCDDQWKQLFDRFHFELVGQVIPYSHGMWLENPESVR